ncbi:aldehyde dehydrogenase family protein [Streptomyces massasporeus]|uniref:aldehyde dehydrogenase family protein n=1 Tax=Streptomyces massasporeus TaxID=67324 RepID=UPI0033D16C4D
MAARCDHAQAQRTRLQPPRRLRDRRLALSPSPYSASRSETRSATGGNFAGSQGFAHRSVYGELLERVGERTKAIRIGDPQQETTELGPLAFEDQRDKVAGTSTSGAARAPGH